MSSCRGWILSQPRPGKLGVEEVGPREEEGQWRETPVFRRRGFGRSMEKGWTLLERRAPPRLEGGFVGVSSRDGPSCLPQSPWLDLLRLWQLPIAPPHTCPPPTATWMDPWRLPDLGCQLKLLSEAFAKSVPCSNTFRGSLWPTE